MHIALELKVFLALLLGASLIAAATAKPLDRPRISLVGLVLGASLMLYLIAGGLIFAGSSGAGLFALVIASEGMCLTAWLGRSLVSESDDDQDGGIGPTRKPIDPDAPDGGQVDWPLFESLRRSWSAERSSRSGEPGE